MVTLSINYERGAIAPQILAPGFKICSKTYLQSPGSHIFPNIDATYWSDPVDDEGSRKWVWMQDGASSHTAAATTAYLDKQLGRRRWIRDWPPSSPDLNPLDFGFWPILKEAVAKMAPQSIPRMKACVIKACSALKLSLIQKTIAEVLGRLRLLIEGEWRAFEYKLKSKQ